MKFMTLTALPADNRRFVTQVLCWALAICALTVAFKYLVVERQAIAAICESAAPEWWCPIREAIILVFYSKILAMVSLALGLVALLLRGRPLALICAVVAIILAAPSIVLWGADYAAPGFVLGLLRLLRD